VRCLPNLGRDIGEQQNLADQEPGKVKELAASWNQWNSEMADAKWFPNRGAAKGAKKKSGKKKCGRNYGASLGGDAHHEGHASLFSAASG
jgi:hypothetical protein